MKKIYWEVCIVLKEPDPRRGNIELIPCKDKRAAISTANKIKCHKYSFIYDYEAIFVQANNGTEMIDDCEIRIA